LKVVFDTNIFISAFVIPGGKSQEAYLHALKGDLTLCSSVAILTETAQNPPKKFGWGENNITRFLKTIAKVAILSKARPHLPLLVYFCPSCFMFQLIPLNTRHRY